MGRNTDWAISRSLGEESYSSSGIIVNHQEMAVVSEIGLGIESGGYDASDKKQLRLEVANEATLAAFRARLTEEEVMALEALKAAEPDLCGRWNDAFLMRFVWARKLDVARAGELLKNHVAWRKEVGLDGREGEAKDGSEGKRADAASQQPSLAKPDNAVSSSDATSQTTGTSPKGGLDAEEFERTKAYLKCAAFPWSPGNYTKQGHSVLYLRAKHLDKPLLAEMGVEGVLKANWMSLDTTMDHDIDVARHGGVIVEDLEGASFFELMAIVRGEYAWDMRKVTQSVQNNLPFRVAGILVLNAPWYIRLLMSCIKPILKPSMRKKVHVCSSYDDLLHYFTPEQLPTFYGGQYEVSTQWVDEVIAKRGQLSEGQYVDPSPRSPSLVLQYSGQDPILSAEDIRTEAKKKKKQKK